VFLLSIRSTKIAEICQKIDYIFNEFKILTKRSIPEKTGYQIRTTYHCFESCPTDQSRNINLDLYT